MNSLDKNSRFGNLDPVKKDCSGRGHPNANAMGYDLEAKKALMSCQDCNTHFYRGLTFGEQIEFYGVVKQISRV